MCLIRIKARNKCVWVWFGSCQSKNANLLCGLIGNHILTWTNFEVVRFNWIVWNMIVCLLFLFTQKFSICSGVRIIQPNTFTKCTGVCLNWPVCYIWNQRVCTLREVKLFMPLVRLIVMTHKHRVIWSFTKFFMRQSDLYI